MNNLNRYEIKGTKSTPRVFYDFDEGELEITGKSFPSAPYELYKKMAGMLDLYNTCDLLKVTVDLDYMNTVSSKHLLELLKQAKEKFVNLEIIWIYDINDQDLLEVGYTFYEILNVSFEFKSK